MEFLRGILGVIAVGCAFMAGRAVGLVRKGRQKNSYAIGWLFRTLACVIAVAYRNPFDIADISVGSLVIVAFAIAFWDQWRPKKEDDAPVKIFTDEP
jgi:hypothetical protein